jgi:subtilisin family serine protease
MAGDIAAHGHGVRSGALGIAPDAKILPIADTDDTGHATDSAMATSIQYATQHGAKVISISQGGVSSSPSLAAAVAAAQESDVVVVAAAGDRSEGDLTVDSPANLPGVIAVTAIGRDGYRIAESVSGPTVMLAAPGVDIASTAPSGGYAEGTGTSDAAAITAGAVALVRSKYPNLSAAEVIHRLTATATDKGSPGRDNEYGYGVINIVAALTADVPPLSASAGATAPVTDQPASNGSSGAQPARTRSSLPFIIPIVAAGLVLLVIVGWRVARQRTP